MWNSDSQKLKIDLNLKNFQFRWRTQVISGHLFHIRIIEPSVILTLHILFW